MRPRDALRYRELDQALDIYHRNVKRLPGIQTKSMRESFIEQILDSIRRVRYISVISSRSISEIRSDPHSELFDPLKSAILHKKQGNIDEAFWLVFLATHFGKNRKSGWRLTRDVYGRLGSTPIWTWERISQSPNAFRKWLANAQKSMKTDGVVRGFGNHRKYQSIDAQKPSGTGAAVESYVKWIQPFSSHQQLIKEAERQVGKDPKKMFSYLFESMNAVASFGRMAKFDYLTMLSKIGLAELEPESTYMDGATGPFSGGCLLYKGSVAKHENRKSLEADLIELDKLLKVGMQVIEDALCNWQKSPKAYLPYQA